MILIRFIDSSSDRFKSYSKGARDTVTVDLKMDQARSLAEALSHAFARPGRDSEVTLDLAESTWEVSPGLTVASVKAQGEPGDTKRGTIKL
ncbi:hypothetical protein ES703_72621 [subsurface metagenome]